MLLERFRSTYRPQLTSYSLRIHVAALIQAYGCAYPPVGLFEDVGEIEAPSFLRMLR